MAVTSLTGTLSEYGCYVSPFEGTDGRDDLVRGFSSEDGKSATVARQKGLYDAAVAAHPSSILSLQHEVHREST